MHLTLIPQFRMDASFEATTFAGNAGWGGDDPAGAPPFQASSTNAFDRVPLPVRIEDITNGQIEDDKIQLGVYSFGTVTLQNNQTFIS